PPPAGSAARAAGTFATAGGGRVPIAADGTFLYSPKARPGLAPTTSDTFNYRFSSDPGGTGAPAVSSPGTVTLTRAGRGWFGKNDLAAGNGPSPTPFYKTNPFNPGPRRHDGLYVSWGAGASASSTATVTMKSGQQYLGQGTALVVNGANLVAAGLFALIGGTIRLASNVLVNGLDMSTGAQRAITNFSAGIYFTVTGVHVQPRDVSATTGTAIDIGGTGNTGSMSFRSVSASGGANGIVLQNFTGGSFIVNGDGVNTSVGGNGSGGTIGGMSGPDNGIAGTGIYLNNVRNVTLRRMTLNGTKQNYGIRGYLVNGFALEYSTVTDTNGTAPSLPSPENYGEGSIYFGNSATNGITGTATFTNDVINGGRGRNLSIVNTASGSTVNLTVKGCNFGAIQNFNDGGTSLAVEARVGNNVQINSIVGGVNAGEGNTFTSAVGDLANFTGQSNTTMNVQFTNNTMSNNHAFNVIGGGNLNLSTRGTMNFAVSGNSMRAANGSAVTFFKAAANMGAPDPSLSGTFTNNTIGVAGVVDSGSKTGNGIFVSAAGNGAMSYTITGNTIQRIHGNAHIFADNTG